MNESLQHPPLELPSEADLMAAEAHGAILHRLDKTPNEKQKELNNIHDYVQMATSPKKEEVENDLGIEFRWLTPRDKYYLFQAIKSSDEDRIKDIKKFFHTFSFVGIETFVSLDYDKELGNEIIQYGFRNPERAKELFTYFSVVLGTIEQISNQIKIGVKDSLSKEEMDSLGDQVYEAMLRKLKDVLLAGVRSEKYDISAENTIDALQGLQGSLDLINEFLKPHDSYVTKIKIKMPKGQSPQFLLTDLNGHQYRLKYIVRPRADEQAQARINFELFFNTKNPNEKLRKVFEQETTWIDNEKRKGVQNESVFRIGIDLDTHDTLNPTLSLDMGRSAIESERRNASGETLGNILAKVSGEGTHTPYSFDKRFSDPETFAKLAESLNSYLQNLS